MPYLLLVALKTGIYNHPIPSGMGHGEFVTQPRLNEIVRGRKVRKAA